jgi:hypothetical protein
MKLNRSGLIVPKRHSHTEMALGWKHLVKGRWVETEEKINILPNGTAVADNGQQVV